MRRGAKKFEVINSLLGTRLIIIFPFLSPGARRSGRQYQRKWINMINRNEEKFNSVPFWPMRGEVGEMCVV